MDFKLKKNLNIQSKIIIINIFLLLVLIAVIIFIIKPSIKDIKMMQERINYQYQDVETKYQRGQSLRKLAENLKEIEPQVEKLDKVFVNQNKELDFITTLELAANEAGVTQKINITAPSGKNKNNKKMSYLLVTKGNFYKQIAYLNKLESLNYYINIKNLDISSIPGEEAKPSQVEATNAGGNISLTLAVETYSE